MTLLRGKKINSGNDLGVWGLIAFIVIVACASYLVSGQPAIALSLVIGMFPIVMSLAMRKKN